MVTHLKINEIFYSIQGESLLAGKPTTFVRTTACNLRCGFCDSRYSFREGKVMEVEDILTEVRKNKTKYVCLTGGEPLGQQGIYPLMGLLLKSGYTVSLETNGSFIVDKVPAEVIKVIDLKCPDSDESDAMVWENCDLVQPHDQFKFVVSSRADFDWSLGVCETRKLFDKCPVLFSPVHGKVKPLELAEWVLESGAPATFQMQLHKELWGEKTRGV